ncbi:TIGR03086 family metal-binding protein [Spirillospora sp. NBC_01491]|uniref:TIGR03086 family metal-binding protein n=1 Tax=Spirillospora sp. NBC_01491 TaxID=2976007 RepID=UPI002E32C122|nr:TIGR03086 family metal-binding protein [Spirillospora sp. NBC_01491]
MELRSLMVPAADGVARIVRGVPDGRLGSPTPCPDWDVRALLNHLILWTGRAGTAARKQPPPAPGEDHDFTAEPGWAERFAVQARETAEAWTDPAAWEGDTSLSGGGGMSAAYIGGIVFGEFVLHGWDLAVATGQHPDLPADLVEAAHRQLVPTAAMAREYAVFGPEVPVPEESPQLDRLLGLSGRDPDWKP